MTVSAKRIGILGGSFDPIHLGHLAAATTCLQALKLDQVRFIPCQQAILKSPLKATPEQRAKMVSLAIHDEPCFLLDRRELQRHEPSYALFTLQSLKKDFPHAQFFWIMGEDAFADFQKWYHWQEIAECCDLVVVSRQGRKMDVNEKKDIEKVFQSYQHQVIHVSMPYVNLASTDIRENAQTCLTKLPEAVQKFILENKLYFGE